MVQAFSDPAFRGNKTVPVHRWVPWIAGFSSEFAAEALAGHLPDHGQVLDPFCGVGTTLVEALRQGRRAVGFEVNPYAALAARTKARAREIDPEALAAERRRFAGFYAEALRSRTTPRSRPPPGFRTRAPFFSPRVLRKVLLVCDFVEQLDGERSPIADVMRIALGATLVSCSNYSYEPSLGRRASAGREDVHDFPVGEAIESRLDEMTEDVRWLRGSSPPRAPRPEVVTGSFFRHQDQLAPGSIDLVLTSPPYLNNYHYNRNTRPHLYWLGFATRPRDLRPLEEANFGKTWQAVRDGQRVALGFRLSGSDLAQRVAALRDLHGERGVYGGNGWANYAACYFNDCWRLVGCMRRLLRRRGVALIVVGNSILQGIEFATDRYLAAIAEAQGLELVGIHVPRATRVGSSIIRSDVRVAKAPRAGRLYEAVVELRQPGSPRGAPAPG